MVSILLPFKDEEDYLKPCIDSILNQTYPHWELILIDDGSTDKSVHIAKAYAEKNARILYFLNEGMGVIRALQTGYKHCTGHLITRMDGDDLKTPDNLEQLVNCVEPGVVAVGQVKYFRDGGLGEGYMKYAGWLNVLSQNNNHFSEVYKECVIPSPCWMMYKIDLDAIGAFSSHLYPEDYDLCFRMYRAGLKTMGTRSVIHFWRDYDTRSSRTSELYSNNAYLELKLNYFLDIDYRKQKSLVLWGAGKKSKVLAQLLNNRKVDYQWITSNPKKIEHVIYERSLESSIEFPFSKEHQTIIVVSQPSGQEEIRHQIKNSAGLFYWFC